MADEVQSEEVATHTIVETGVSEDEVPFGEGWNLGCAFECLEGLFAQLLV